MSKIFITGATGNVGAELIKLLSKSEIKIVAGVTSVKNASLMPPKVEVRQFNFLDHTTYASALKDVDKVFLVRPPQMANPKNELLPFLQFLKDKKIKQVVFLSLLGAEKNPLVPHMKIEEYITELALPYTFLRPSFFMQNFSTTHRDDIKLNREIFLPAGRGKTSFIDIRDIAAVAVKTLTEDGHVGKAYSLTGDSVLDYYEVADIFTRVLCVKVAYKNPSLLSFVYKNIKNKVPLGFILVMAGIYTTARLGLAKITTSDFGMLMHRQTISFEKFVKDNKSCWV